MAERKLLGMMLQDNSVFFKTTLLEKHFLTEEHKKIFVAIKRCIEDGVVADISTVIDYDDKLMPSKLASLTSEVATTANWKFYEDKVLEDYGKRSMKMLALQLKDSIEGKTYEELIDFVERQMVEITSRSDHDKVHQMKDLIHPFVVEVEKRYNARGILPGISTGFGGLDDFMYGFQQRRLYIVGARPSQGKSALMLNMACHAAFHGNQKVGIISLESSKEELTNRIFASEGSINSGSLATGYLQESSFSKIIDVGDRIVNKDLYVYDVPNISLGTLKAQARRMVSVYGCKMIFIDYLQLVECKEYELARDNVKYISMQLKGLARSLEIPIIAMAQLRRDAENRKPMLSDFSDSSQIEKDADVAILIYHKTDKDSGDKRTYLLIEKNRDGQTGAIEVVFVPHYVRFNAAERGVS